jgi:hypothetical protein
MDQKLLSEIKIEFVVHLRIPHCLKIHEHWAILRRLTVA